jgi:hypothetical protein
MHEHRSASLLQGPSQSNVDFPVAKRFPLTESEDFQFQADFFNVLNHAHRDNPIGDASTSDFGKILSFSASPRIMQFSLRFNF